MRIHSGAVILSLMLVGCSAFPKRLTTTRDADVSVPVVSVPVLPFLAPGTRVRAFTKLWSEAVTGMVATSSPDTLRLHAGYGLPVTIPADLILRLDKSRGQTSKAGDSAYFGMMVGGIAAWAAVYFGKEGELGRTDAAFKWGAMFSIGMGTMGAVVGSGDPVERWEIIWPRQQRLGLRR